MIQYKQFVFNPIQVNTWLLYNDNGACAVFDPGCHDLDEENELEAFFEMQNLAPDLVLATHGHFDHVPGVGYLKKMYGTQFLGHELDKILIKYAREQAQTFGFVMGDDSLEFDKCVVDEEMIDWIGAPIKVLHVPGHSPGSVAYYFEESSLLVAGDVLFQGSIGRTDLPGGHYETLITSIKEKLLVLPDHTVVLPGHGPSTTIAQEKKSNPFLN